MSSVVISGDTSGAITLAAPAVAGTNTITLPALTGTAVISGQNSAITAGTSQASTSGTSIDFTSIPSWVKRVTVMFNGTSTNGSSNYLIQIGSGSVATSGYTSSGGTNGGTQATSTAGFVLTGTQSSSDTQLGHAIITLVDSNKYVCSSILGEYSSAARSNMAGGNVTLGGSLDRVRITTVNGTDTFDAGSINILYE